MNLSRKLFPALASNDFVYLNSGGSGPPSRETISVMRELDDLCSGPAYLEGVGLYAHQRDAYARARTAAARLIGAGPDDVALTLNTSHGMNLGVFSLDWNEGDEVITSRSEHPGCLVPLHAIQERYGVSVKLVDPPVTVEKVEAAMSPRTRLVSISHVDWTTGEILPLQEISALARECGALTLVDGAQSVGNIPVNVPATGVDMYAFTGHKWMLGPEGMGSLYARPGLETASTSLGYASLSDPARFVPEGGYLEHLHRGARRFEASTMSPALATGFAHAAESVSERGAEGFEEILRRAELLSGLLEEMPRITLSSPRPAQSGLVSFEIEGMAAQDAAERLLQQRLIVRFIPEPYPYVRASTHLFNSEEDLETLTKAVGTL